VVDFRSRNGAGPLTLLARAEAGSFGNDRAQGAVSGEAGPGSAFLSASWFRQDGFRAHNAQEAARANAVAEFALAPGITLSSGLLWSDSSLQLPGPQTLAQIAAGDRSAQPGNVAGDWQRDASRMRVQLGLTADLGQTDLALAGAFMATDVMFRRRDVLDEASSDWTVKAGVQHRPGGNPDGTALGAELLWQRGDRNARQWLNGGGTIPSFTGARGRLWADNDLMADRLSITATLSTPVSQALRAELAAGASRHLRRIDEQFAIRAARPAATLDRTYSGFHGLASLSARIAPALELFGAVSRVMEPPTFDLLLTNVAGMGSGNTLVDGANPRRPVINDLDAQTSTTVELGARGRLGPVDLDITLYRGWLQGEFVSTADFVSQVVSSVGNADQTRRWGVEAAADTRLASPGLQAGDALTASAQWTWTDARFADDPVFGNRRLPILPPHVIGLGLAYAAPSGFSGTVSAQIVPTGGYVDYAQTLRAGGYAVLGARASYWHRGLTLFVEGRNLTDRRAASSVIAAQNNVGGQDSSAFAPVEGRAIFAGLELALQPR
jgi:iron complex outermembrane receptor protein